MNKVEMVLKVLIVVVLVFAVATPAPCEIIPDDFGEAVGELYGTLTKQYLFLCMACVGYYQKEGRWPANEEELAKTVEVKEPRPGTDDELIRDMFKTMDVKFTPLPDGSVIMEANFDKELENKLALSGFGKCILKVRIDKTDEGINFVPTADTEGDKDYFPIKMTMPVTESAAEDIEKMSNVKT